MSGTFTLWDGAAEVPAYFTLSDEDLEETRSASVDYLGRGYASTAAMLGQQPFYCAHRGGSLNFPEMSIRAYTDSALRGYRALEVSLALTTDGVYYGLHDATINRTSALPSTPAIRGDSLTWAQVQGYEIKASTTNNPSQPDQPYMRFEELATTYYGSHVIFLDPKVIPQSGYDDLFDMLDALPGNPQSRIVIKYFYDNTVLSSKARARGYKSWGFWFTNDLQNNPGSVATFAQNWDILGLSYSAPQSQWDSLIATGLPVMGHICPDQAAVDEALSKGASGVMVSGVLAVAPV